MDTRWTVARFLLLGSITAWTILLVPSSMAGAADRTINTRYYQTPYLCDAPRMADATYFTAESYFGEVVNGKPSNPPVSSLVQPASFANDEGERYINAAPGDGEEASPFGDKMNDFESRLQQAEMSLATMTEATEDLEKDLKKRPVVGGRIHLDYVYYTQGGGNKALLGDMLNGVEFRRARFFIKGKITDQTIYKFQFDFDQGELTFKDVYFGMTDLPGIGNFRIGNFKEPFFMEELTSSNCITFMERALPDVFAPSRRVGVMIHNTYACENGTWWLGTFRGQFDDETGRYDNDDNGQTVTGRITFTPIYDDSCDQLTVLHLGAAYSFRHLGFEELRFRQRPEIHLSPIRFVDTGIIPTDDYHLVDLELALARGPLLTKFEYAGAMTHAQTGEDLGFSGSYFQVSYVLTGESYEYDREDALFCYPTPCENFYCRLNKERCCYESGCGAWELAFRWSYLNLDDQIIAGGILNDVTLGLNWYWNKNTRFMFNLVNPCLDRFGGRTTANIFAMRAQVKF